MRALDAARVQLMEELKKKTELRKKLDADIYKLETAIANLKDVAGLQRTRRVSYDKTCAYPPCAKAFKAKTSTASFCSLKCSHDANRKGVTLVKGDAVSTK